uniref:Uncharacterized protein n=1 Tax=Glossina austeni TaxID=7395 RepID=A0A1A9UDY1_GLOAU
MALLIEADSQPDARHSTSFVFYENSLPTREAYNCRKYGEPMPPVKPINRTVYFFGDFIKCVSAADVKTKPAPVGGTLRRNHYELYAPILRTFKCFLIKSNRYNNQKNYRGKVAMRTKFAQEIKDSRSH